MRIPFVAIADARAVASLFLRLLGVSGKFVAVLVLAHAGSPRDVGEFGLFFGAINVLLFAIGLDFHLFAVREVLAQRAFASRLQVISGQATLDAAIYALVLLVSLALWLLPIPGLEGLPVLWFGVILVADHLGQELCRLFTILRSAAVANVIYAIKTGAWGWLAAAAIYLKMAPAHATSFYAFWLLADLVAIAVGALYLFRTFAGNPISLPPAYVHWVVRGIRISRLFYVSSVATMCLAYLDRFIIAREVSLSEAGLYAFWQSIMALLPVVVYAMAGMHFLPLLVESYRQKRMLRFAYHRRGFLIRTITVSLLAGLFILMLSPWIPFLLGKPAFAMSLPLVVLLTLAACCNTLWQVPYQILYSASDDRFLAAAVTSITALATALTFGLVANFGIAGAAASGVLSNASMYLVLDRRSRRHAGAERRDPPR